MASNAPFADADDAHMASGAALYAAPNGGASPGHHHQHQQHQQHMASDADLQLQDNIAQLQRSSEMMHPAGAPGQQMNPMSAHHHFQTPPRPNHSPQQMAQSVMSLEEHHMYGDHDAAARKRSKVSRACDECRRKKIRCDATNENGPEACSSCKRTGARCQFSRQPMKRGPSKGYIKELADRLNSLENQIQNPQLPGQPFDYAGMNDQALGDAHNAAQFDSRKRTHSMSEGLHDPYNSRLSWSGQDRDVLQNGSHVRRPSYSDLTLAGSLITGSNEETIRAYYSSIHPTLPILSHNSPSLNRLGNCPSKLREAFFLALECSVRSVSPLALPASDFGLSQMTQQCSESLEGAQHTLSDLEHSRQFFNNLVYCQALLLLSLALEKSGPGSSGSAAELLGRLAGRISDLGLNDVHVVAALRDQDRESFDDARRLFWMTFVLDRFHAASKSKDIVLPLHVGSVSRDDLGALGEDGFHLARAADIIGQITSVIKAGNVPNLDPSSPFAFEAMTMSSPNSLYLSGQLTRFRESLEITDLPNTAASRLSYQYLRIMTARLSSLTSPKETLALSKEFLSQTKSMQATPLHHYYASLLAATLSEMSDRVETQVEAHATIKELEDAISNGQFVHRLSNGLGWDTAIRDALHSKTAQSPTPNNTGDRTSPTEQNNMAGLQHLAAAAVGEREGADTRPASSGANGGLNTNSQEVKHDVTAAMAAASEAAAAQATAAAALQNSAGSHNGGGNYDSNPSKDGF